MQVYVPPKHQMTFNTLHHVTLRKIDQLIDTTVGISYTTEDQEFMQVEVRENKEFNVN
jgi:hypothetical protein